MKHMVSIIPPFDMFTLSDRLINSRSELNTPVCNKIIDISTVDKKLAFDKNENLLT